MEEHALGAARRAVEEVPQHPLRALHQRRITGGRGGEADRLADRPGVGDPGIGVELGQPAGRVLAEDRLPGHEDGEVPVALLQGGLGLPERSYYLDPSEGMAAVRTQYITHVAAMLKLAGLSNVLERAAAVGDLETRMAQAHAGREASGDVRKGNNHWSRADFTRKAPGLDWEAFFGAVLDPGALEEPV